MLCATRLSIPSRTAGVTALTDVHGQQLGPESVHALTNSVGTKSAIIATRFSTQNAGIQSIAVQIIGYERFSGHTNKEIARADMLMHMQPTLCGRFVHSDNKKQDLACSAVIVKSHPRPVHQIPPNSTN